MTGTVRLSWSADEQVTEIEWPAGPEVAAGGGEAILDVYMTVEVDAPIDSLGFFLRWSAEGSDANLRLLALQKIGDYTETRFQVEPGAAEAADGWFAPLPTASMSEFLGRVAEPADAGMTRYRIKLRLAATGGPRLRIQTHGVTAAAQGQAAVHLGSPALGTSKGWTLRFVPEITEVRGIMNRSFLFSDLTLFGIDLEQVARLAIVDVDGDRVAPNVLKSRQSERIDMTMANKIVSAGLCDIEIMSGAGLRKIYAEAVEAKALDCRQPGDTSKNAIPGSHEWEDCK